MSFFAQIQALKRTLGIAKDTYMGLGDASAKVYGAIGRGVRDYAIKPATEALVVRPALRAGELAGTGVAKVASKVTGNPAYYNRAVDYATRDKQIKSPIPGLGQTTLKAPKPRQLAGEALETASYLYTPTRLAKYVKPTVKGIGGGAFKIAQKPIQRAAAAIGEGAFGGYMADVGFGLQDKEQSTRQALKPGFGTAIGAAIPTVGVGYQASKAAVRQSKQLLNELGPAGAQAGFIKSPLGGEAPKPIRQMSRSAEVPSLEKTAMMELGDAPEKNLQTLEQKLAEQELVLQDKRMILEANPAKDLERYAVKNREDRIGYLPEVTGEGRSRFARSGDDIVTEFGFKDSEEARGAYDAYKQQKEAISKTKQELALARKDFQMQKRTTAEMRKVQEKEAAKASFNASRALDDGGKVAIPIPGLETAITDAPNLKDLSGFKAQTRDVYRNFKAVFGKNFDQVKKTILDPFDSSKGRFIDEQKIILDDLDRNVVKRLGIQKGSKMSAALMDYGEGVKKYDDLVKEFGTIRANNIVEADKWFRQKYDELINKVNEIRKIVYPNRSDKLVPYRKDYYRHFQELSGLSGLKNLFDTPSGIDPKLVGVSPYTKPRSKFLSLAQRRLGTDSTRDAVGGFLNYVPSASYAMHIDPHISKFRGLAKNLAEATGEKRNLNNFIEYLQDYANDLSGKTNPADRFLQKIIPGGRKTFQVINWFNKRVKANTILGNVSSSLAQIFNVPQGVASAKQHSVKGFARTVGSIFADNAPMKQSTFIKERYASSMYNRFDQGILNNTKKFAAWMVGVLDEVGTKFIWNSHYEKALSQGISNPAKYADDLTRALVAGRGVGEVPLLQKAKTFQLVAPFQLEVGNLWHVMGDMVKAKDFGGIAVLFVANYLLNRAVEGIRGSDVAFDPINAVIEGVQMLDEEQGVRKFAGRQVGEVLSNIPLGQTLASMYPEQGSEKLGLPARADFFGAGDPTRYGSGILAAKGLADPLYKVLPGFAGGQIKKTIEGVTAYANGASMSKAGRVRYPIEQKPINLARTALFGQYATPEARQYFKEGRSVLSEKQSQDLLKSPDKMGDYNDLMTVRQFSKEFGKTASETLTQKAEKRYEEMKQMPKPEAAATFDKLAKEDKELAKSIVQIVKEEQLGLGSDDRAIKALGVENGERSQFIKQQLDKLATKEEKAQLWGEYTKKKIITKDVAKQLMTLLQ